MNFNNNETPLLVCPYPAAPMAWGLNGRLLPFECFLSIEMNGSMRNLYRRHVFTDSDIPGLCAMFGSPKSDFLF